MTKIFGTDLPPHPIMHFAFLLHLPFSFSCVYTPFYISTVCQGGVIKKFQPNVSSTIKKKDISFDNTVVNNGNKEAYELLR